MMVRISAKRIVLCCGIIVLYIRAAIFYLRSDDTEEDPVLDSIINMREHSNSKMEHSQQLNRNILENDNLIIKQRNGEVVDEKAIHDKITISNIDNTGSEIESRKNMAKSMEKDSKKSTSNLRREFYELSSTKASTLDSMMKDNVHGTLKTRINLRSTTNSQASTNSRTAEAAKVNKPKKKIEIIYARNTRKASLQPVRQEGQFSKERVSISTTTPTPKATKSVAKHTLGKINMYIYKDIVSTSDNTNVYWNPLFPHLPHTGQFVYKLEDDKWIETSMARRFLGYFHVHKTGFYTFNVKTRMGIDLLIFDGVFSNESIIFRFTITENEMRKQNLSSHYQLYEAVSNEIWLEENKAYPVDIIQATFLVGRFSLKFKCKGDSSYTVIDANFISPLYDNTSTDVKFPHCYANTKGVPALRRKFNEDKRLMFASRIQLNSKSCKTGVETCPYIPSYLFKWDKVKLYYGQGYVKRDLTFPYDHTNYHDEERKKLKFLNESIAMQVATDVFNFINQENKGIYKLENIVHVEENHEKRRYFVEIDLQNTIDGKSYRFGDYFLKTADNKKFCLPEGYASKWRHKVPIYLVCTVKNQKLWFQYLIQSIEELIKRTNDKNLHLIVVDFHSTDANVKGYLQRSTLNYTFLQLTGNFSKVKGLNEGVRHIPTNDSIVFVMDLHLKIPDHIFDQARKHTIQGTTAYCPILVRLSGQENPEYTKLTDYSIWQDMGYGMMSIFKSDWDRIGGMNEKLFSYKWGGEDWEFVDRVIVGRLELIHQRLPGFYHIYHSTKGTWDGTKLF